MKERNKIMRFFGLHPQNDVRRKFAFTLAEGATHVDNSNNKRRFAFTLAEVLVTLGIIGVVAVLTVPNVISSYQKKVYVTQLQKGYAQLQQAFSLAMANDEVDDMQDTTLIGTIPDGIYADTDIEPFVSELKKYLKISKYCAPTSDPQNDSCFGIAYSNLNDTENDFYMNHRLKLYTPSGIVYYFRGLSPCASGSADDDTLVSWPFYCAGSVQIDVNGDKKPNKFGRDLFSVALFIDGSLVFEGSEVWVDSVEDVLSYYSNWQYGCALDVSDMGYLGDYCGGRIFDNGWVMDY